MKIHGRNAVREAVLAGQTIDRLIVQKGQQDAGANRLIAEAKSRGIKIDFRDRAALDREVPDGRHQGFVAEVTDFVYSEVDDILGAAQAKGEDPFIVIVDGVEDPHNLGSILRVAECAGVHGVIIPDRRQVSVNDTVVRVSAGAAAHVKVARVTNINNTIDALKARNIFVFGAETGGGSVYAANLTGAIAIVIGGEGEGIHALTRKKCDGIVTIPLYGKVNSLNASVACGIVVFEALHQRKSGGSAR